MSHYNLHILRFKLPATSLPHSHPAPILTTHQFDADDNFSGILDLDKDCTITKVGIGSQAEKAGIKTTKNGEPWIWRVVEVDGVAVHKKTLLKAHMKKAVQERRK